MVVASGSHPAIDASMGRWLCDDALLDKELHAVHGGVLKLGDQTGTGMTTFRRLGAVRGLATVDAGRLAWGADGKMAASDLHLSGLLRFAVRGWRVDLRSQINEPQGIRRTCWNVASLPPGNLALRDAGAPCNFGLRQRAPQ